jgi:phage shock protein PspC (stress-responsive transcriptional regulator)
MKKTLTINISGNVFHIDDDAYEKLKIYLDTLYSHYANTNEGREIYTDIESRVSEIFIDPKAPKQVIITIEMVDKLIEKLGKPEDIFEMDENDEHNTTHHSYNKRKKLFRNPDQRVFGGVCSGLGAFLGISSIWLRIIFLTMVLIGFGIPILLYFILWIAVLKAVTAGQKLQMKGERVNISNIERTIKEEYQEVKKNFENLTSRNTKHISGVLDKLIDFLSVLFRFVLKIAVILLGIILIIIGFSSLISFLWSLFFIDTAFSISPNLDASVIALSTFFTNGFELNLFSTCISLIIAIPLIMLIFIGIKLILNLKTNNKIIGMSAFGAWLLAIVIAGVILLRGLNNIATEDRQTEIAAIENIEQKQLLFIANIDNIGYDHRDVLLTYNRLKKIKSDNNEYLIGTPSISFEKSYKNKIEVKVIKKANGSDEEKAKENINNIQYEWDNENGHLVLDRYFTIIDKQLYRTQKVEIVIYIPEGQKVYIDSSMREMSATNNGLNFYSGYNDKTYIMKSNGILSIVDEE